MKSTQQLIRRIRHGAPGVRWFLGIVVTVGTAACAPSPEPTHQTVEYYLENEDARVAKVAECANDPGALGKTPDCINAKQAEGIAGIGSLRDLPPMGLMKDLEQAPGRTDSASGSSRPPGADSASREPR